MSLFVFVAILLHKHITRILNELAFPILAKAMCNLPQLSSISREGDEVGLCSELNYGWETNK